MQAEINGESLCASAPVCVYYVWVCMQIYTRLWWY